MNEPIKKLAEQAGFCFWEDESWKPDGATIDWSCLYDNEFQKYTELLIKECAEVAFCNAHASGSDVFMLIKQHFGIEQ